MLSDEVTVKLFPPATVLVTVITFAAGFGAENPDKPLIPSTPPAPTARLSAVDALSAPILNSFGLVVGFVAVAVIVVELPALSVSVTVVPGAMLVASVIVIVQVAKEFVVNLFPAPLSVNVPLSN